MRANQKFFAVQFITLIVITVCLSGCKSATDPTPASTDNYLFGSLKLVDEFNNIVTTDKSGFEVSATDGKKNVHRGFRCRRYLEGIQRSSRRLQN